MKREKWKVKTIDRIISLRISKREAEELIKVSDNIERDITLLKNKYPIQYLIGYVSFYGYKINVDKRVLIPRYETELLVEKTINYIKTIFKGEKTKIADIGTGSGNIAIALKKEFKDNIVHAVDISDVALDVAISNAKVNKANVKFYLGNMLEPLRGKYDVIISNPPYIKVSEHVQKIVKNNEPAIALYAGDMGTTYYEEIIKESVNKLKNKGLIAFEIGESLSYQIQIIAKFYYPNAKVITEKDLSDKDRYLFIINE